MNEYYDIQIETLPRDELKKLQLQRLRWQVERCYHLSPFYRERLDRAGVRPEDIRNLDDIRRIPVVTKQELRAEQQQHPPFGRYVEQVVRKYPELSNEFRIVGSSLFCMGRHRIIC